MSHKEMEIDVKELVKYVLSKWVVILLAVLIGNEQKIYGFMRNSIL